MKKFKEEVNDIVLLDKCNNKHNLKNCNVVFFLCPDVVENILMYNKLHCDNTVYIKHANIGEVIVNNKRYIRIINLDDNICLYISLNKKISDEKLDFIRIYISIIISDIIVVNKIKNIEKGIYQLDLALDLGKDIYAIPGSIFKYENYLANFAIKQGAIPICSKYDMKYILNEKKYNVL